MADYWETLGHIADRYPSFLPFLDKPGIAAVLFQAVDEEWSEGRLAAALQATEYWRSTSEANRQYDLLWATDPTEAQRRTQTYVDLVGRVHQELGAKFQDQADFDGFVTMAAREAWNEETIRRVLLDTHLPAGQPLTGSLGANENQVRQGMREFGVPLGEQQVRNLAIDVAYGRNTMEGIADYLRDQAKSLFPTIASALDQGMTVRQYADPYLQLAARTLEMNPEAIDFVDPKWSRALLGQVDDTGVRAPMTLDAWTRNLRTDPIYGYDQTLGARTQAAQFAQQLAQTFGKVA